MDQLCLSLAARMYVTVNDEILSKTKYKCFENDDTLEFVNKAIE